MENQDAVDSEDGIVIRGCLAQSGNPVTFSAIGGGSIKIDFDDSQIEDAAKLAVFLRERPLFISFVIDDTGNMPEKRHGGKRDGAGRPPKE